MLSKLLLLIISIWSSSKLVEDYVFVFYKVDNKVEIIVNDSLVFTSGEMNNNPDLEGDLTFNISRFLTDDEDVVLVRLYNGYEPYPDHIRDKHWEIEYSLFRDGDEFDIMWNEGDDYKTGLVFEEKHLL